MVADVQWQTVRHQVAIAGQVVSVVGERMTKDKNNKPITEPVMQAIAGVRVELVAMPSDFQKHLKLKALQYSDTVWEILSERPDRTQTTADGTFHFLDLPNGSYSLTASLPDVSTQYGTVKRENITVARTPKGAIEKQTDDKGTIINFAIQLVLPSTTISGKVTFLPEPEHPDKMPIAKIHIKESGQFTFSDQQGHYFLNKISVSDRQEKANQPTKLTVLISATGYELASTKISARQGQDLTHQDFKLQRETN